MNWRAGILAVFGLTCVAAVATADIKVVEDEVIFRLRAPEATEVYLVGDFNQWNPTVERMLRVGDAFEVMLFLVEGSYRYKFVVDGKWIIDPDNPGANPELGSPLALVERAGGMTMSTEEPESAQGPPRIRPWVRYIGRSTSKDELSLDFQQIDLGARFERERLRGRVVVSSRDDSWKESVSDVETSFNQGFIEADLGSMRLRGYDEDSTWTSTDPVSLIGKDGLYRYNTGYERHGVALDYAASSFSLRVLYDDHVGRGEQRAVIAPGSLSDFVGGISPDTSVYEYSRSFGDSDRFGLEVYLSLGDVEFGYVRRNDRGLHPGVFAEITRVGGVFPSTVYATRENRSASLYWLGYRRIPLGASLKFAYGSASSDLDRLYRESVTLDPALGVAVPAGGGDAGVEDRFQESDRFAVVLGNHDGAGNGLRWQALWDYVRFDFMDPAPDARANIHRIDGTLEYKTKQWSAAINVLYTDQDYGNTPDDLLVDSPVRNVWLNAWDNFTVANIVGIDRRAYTRSAVKLKWSPENLRVAAATVAGLVTVSNARAEYAWWQADALFSVYRGIYVEIDTRLARYDKPSWQRTSTFASGYAEVGYRGRYVEINIGYGFDPRVFDFVINEFAHIGRTEVLRASVADGALRSEAAEIGRKLLDQEQALENNHSIKLETIIRF